MSPTASLTPRTSSTSSRSCSPDPDLAEGLAREARAFFDRHLHYRALGDYYLATCVERL